MVSFDRNANAELLAKIAIRYILNRLPFDKLVIMLAIASHHPSNLTYTTLESSCELDRKTRNIKNKYKSRKLEVLTAEKYMKNFLEILTVGK